MNPTGGRVAVVFRGLVEDPLNPRLQPMADALQGAGLKVEPVAFHPDHALLLQHRLADFGPGDAVLVWADPLADDGDRTALDQALRHADSAGVWVSARPFVIDRLGTKEVLVTTRDLSWGSDTYRYRDLDEFRFQFPARLAADGVRVLKASRGNGGRTVWKVRLTGGPATTTPGPDAEVVVQHARARDGAATRMTLSSLTELVVDARVFVGWDGTACLVDQEFVPGITRGIVRCYLVGKAVVGFARQYPDGVVPDGPLNVVPASELRPEDVMGLPSPKTMYPPDEAALAGLRERLENDLVPSTARLLHLQPEDLPALWDVDLLLADKTMPPAADAAKGEGLRLVLCEVNASSVIPFPPQAPPIVARHVASALAIDS